MTTKSQIEDLIRDKKINDLKELANSTSAFNLTSILRDLEINEMAVVFRLLEKDNALEIFEQLDVSIQQRLLASFSEDKTREVFEELAPDDRVRLLDELPARVANKMISLLTQGEREMTNDLLGYKHETAGRIMTPEYVRLKADMSIEEALSKIRQNGKDKETIYTLYITDDNRKLIGSTTLRDIVMADSEDKVENIMEMGIPQVNTGTDQEAVARLLQETDLLAVPVVDSENRLVGIITFDDAMDIIEEETTEDIFDKAGLASMSQVETNRSYKLIGGSLLDIWKVRIPFLLITLFGGLAAGFVIGNFEESLEAVAAVAIFIPVVMDMGGNVGTQSSTIFARAFILGHIKPERFFGHLAKEVLVGVSMGAILGTGAGFIAQLWQQVPGIGMAVGLAILFTITLGSFLGFTIPFILNKLGVDQAAGADPIITTIKDITGLLIYFLLVNFFLGTLLT